MFKNIGTAEITLIAVIIIFLFGSKKLPELARGISDSVKEFKKAFGRKQTKEDK